MKPFILSLLVALAGCGGSEPACPKGTVCSAADGGTTGGAPDGGSPDLATRGNSLPDLAHVSSSCVEGDSCHTNDCNYGAIHCEPNGNGVCIVQGNFADGSVCSGGTCQSGVCASCTPDAPCTDACHSGYQQCNGDQATCVASVSQANGTSCGAGKVCTSGTCMACTPGASCDTGNPCYDGTVACTNGYSCQSVEKPNGTSCGSGMVCYYGTCEACVDGADCVPYGTCHKGKLSCTTGISTCVDQGGTAADGAACEGSAYVCKSGVCGYCGQGGSCMPTDKCKTGTIECATGSPVCTVSGNTYDGATCGTDQVCSSGSCNLCKSGVACTPANPCHKGLTSCSSGASVCVDQGSLAFDGTGCGVNLFCKSGVCGACTPGAACSTGNPCQTGKTSCVTGSAVCVPAGATAATTCGSVTKGTCNAGACVCPAGTGFFAGDCQACPGSLGFPQYVNANPTVGVDNQCCGRKSVAGLGGPCATINYGLQSGFTSISVTGDPQGNVSANEAYPIHLGNSTTLYGTVCLPGAAGKDVIHIDGTSTGLQSLTLGTDCQGNAPGAVDGVYVSAGKSVSMTSTLLTRLKNGVHVDSGSATVSNSSIHDVSGDGILCRSDSAPNTTSIVSAGSSTTIYAAAQHDIFASNLCSISASGVTLGDAAPCPAVRRDQFGVYLEGTASLSSSGVNVRCMNQDGVSLRNNAALASNTPHATVSGTVTHNGCAGVYVEVGSASVGGTITHNHWGVVQHSASSSGNGLVTVSGSQLVCNTQTEPGACSGQGVGAQIWNDSGLPLGATGNSFADSPVGVCNCNSALMSCTCTGGTSTPPDGIDVLNAPLSAGTPTTTVTGFNTVSVNCATQ